MDDGIGFNFALQDIKGHCRVDRARPVREGCREGLVHELRNSVSTIDELRVLADRCGDGHLIKILEVPEPHRLYGAASRDEQHRGTIEIGVGQRR